MAYRRHTLAALLTLCLVGAAMRTSAQAVHDVPTDIFAAVPTPPIAFVAVPPCRLVDTRGNGFTGAFGPPSLAPVTPRVFPVAGFCGIPSTAQAVSANFAVARTTGNGFISVWPEGAAQPSPLVSSMNYSAGQIIANAVIASLGTNGGINVYSLVQVDVIIDVNGYFDTAASPLPNGTAGMPVLSFQSSPNTGIYSSAANTFDIATAGIKRFEIAADGTASVPGTLSAGTLQTTGNLLLPDSSGAAGNLLKGGVLFLHDNGPGNTALGRNALAAPTSGTQNTAVGFSALAAANTGFSNTAAGYQSVNVLTSGTENTALGSQAMQAVTDQNSNTAVGSKALQFTTGNGNTALGTFALPNVDPNTGLPKGIGTADNNTAIGVAAMLQNVDGRDNVAIGLNASRNNTSGIGNTVVGNEALRGPSGGDSNTAIGGGALYQATGNRNTALGVSAGILLLNGSNNIYIGNRGAATESGTIRIGESPFQTAAFIIGVSGVAVANSTPVLIDSVTGQLGTAASSRRFKEDIQDMAEASAGLMRLRPVTFHYRKALADGSNPLQYGLIAEEVAEAYPELVANGSDGKPMTVSYHLLPTMLLNELQKEHARGEARQAQIEAQRRQLEAQADELADLLSRLSRLEALAGGQAVERASIDRTQP
jgi:hypothetical protein